MSGHDTNNDNHGVVYKDDDDVENNAKYPDAFAALHPYCLFHTLTKPTIASSEVKEKAEKLYNDKKLAGIWPERLLHVPSMTSYKRDTRWNGTFYNGVKKPQFSILSYKWGLHVIPEGPTLEVNGIDWDPPAIDQKYFTIQEQAKILQKLGQHSGWIWVDVGCITQILMEETLREIIVEPQYFKQAAHRYVWWVDFPSEILQRLMSGINDAGIQFSQALSASSRDADIETLPQIAAGLLDPLAELISIPWFASNWTLREIMLCGNVTILGREGDTFPVDSEAGKEIPATIDMIAEVCVKILAWLQRIYKRSLSAKDQPSRKGLAETVVIKNTTNLEPAAKSLANSAGQLTLGALVSRYMYMVETRAPFFLYASDPAQLHYWTKALLETGVLVTEGLAGPDVHAETDDDFDVGSSVCNGRLVYHGWGKLYRINCECSQLCSCKSMSEHSSEQFCLRYRRVPAMNKSHWGDISYTNVDEYSSKVCMPCLLGISFRVRANDTVNPHTAISIPRQKFEARTGVRVHEYRESYG